jgi:hypothetical protein
MTSENGVVQIVLSSLSIVGIVGYVGHSVWTGYQDFKKDTYEKLSKKRDTDDCNEFRRIAEREQDREVRHDHERD